MLSNIFWVAMAIPAAILLGGFIIWAISKPMTKPNLATRWQETEAEILEEYNHETSNGKKHELIKDKQGRIRKLEKLPGKRSESNE